MLTTIDPATADEVPSARRLARVVFIVAGIWGLLIMTPLYFAYDAIGRAYPPPLTHPDIYYGFVGVTLVWQIAFLLISTDPVRYHTLMLIAVLEKGIYVGSVVLLFLQGHLEPIQAATIVIPDGTLGVLFLVVHARLLRAHRSTVATRAAWSL